jgi:hypothetical protein
MHRRSPLGVAPLPVSRSSEDAVRAVMESERREAAMPYGRCVIYSFRGDGDEIVEKARSGMLPIFKKQSGFLAYGVTGPSVRPRSWRQ